MKNLLILFQLFVVNILTLSQGFNDICSPSLQHVFAVGTSGAFYKSTNGGTTYSSSIIGNENLNSVFSVGGKVWSAGDNGKFYKSADFGVNWEVMELAGGIKLNSVFFIDSLTGFICANDGEMLKSIDGGASWVVLNTGVTHNLTKVKFDNNLTGYCQGDSQDLLRTTNGGSNWHTVPVSVSGSLKTFDVKGNEIIAGLGDDNIYRSTNGGSSWTKINLKILSKPGINDIHIESAGVFYLLLESGSIWKSTNGGTLFTYALSDYLDELSSFCFMGQRSHAAGRNSFTITRSLSLGNYWQLTPNTTYTLGFVQLFVSANSGFNKILDINYQRRGVLYLARRDSLIISSNMGINWNAFSQLPEGNVRTPSQLLVNMRDSSKMLVGKNNGSSVRIYRTSDYGVSWSSVFDINMDQIGNYMNQDPQHPDTVYLGAKDSVFRSTDFGASWMKISTDTYYDWCDIAVSYNNSQVLFGSVHHYPAKLVKSSNGGLNWFMVDFIIDTSFSEMPAIALSSLNPNVVLHAQLGYQNNSTGLKRSYTSGNSWLFNQFTGTSWAVDIAKDDPNLYSYGGVSYNPIFLSTNSGGNFVGTPNMYAEQLLYYDRANLFVNNHGIISKMKVTYNMPVIGIENISSEIPKQFSLHQNYPNPFNPSTNIEFNIAKSSNVKVVIYDITGKIISHLADEQLQPGVYKVKWDAANFPSGVYLYKISAGDFSESRKMILIK